MQSSEPQHDAAGKPDPPGVPRVVAIPGGAAPTFHDRFVDLFEANFQSLYRTMDRLSGDADLAADLAQEAFVRLYRRGSVPDEPRAWLVTVAMNLLRNVQTTRSRRRRLLALFRVEGPRASFPSPDSALLRQRARAAIEQLPEREQRLLLLHAEGYSYRDIATALQLNEASIGTLLARARRRFCAAYEGEPHAPR